jgi:hypothetical protein
MLHFYSQNVLKQFSYFVQLVCLKFLCLLVPLLLVCLAWGGAVWDIVLVNTTFVIVAYKYNYVVHVLMTTWWEEFCCKTCL